MKATTKISIFIGSIASIIPFAILMDTFGILLTTLCLWLTIELSDWACEGEK